ncbi:GTPase Era [Arthrobacter sp. HMSC06H05]|uniref:GTPase Era n=1 Tax=Micrococcaceae TaxID=1268 RepID=UPI0008A5ACB6|nr:MULTISPECIES: GTPase Era [Micrococcaceae]MCG7304186.1 GTPase Era [Pseudoglutamicibacter albus]OFT44340.1 GTPase Era [Arthrobacter sp. HMSC06H05]
MPPAHDFRAGFISLVGRPNAGKSTLTNALVGQKIAITSNKPQTTRHTIRGVVHRENYQLILVDTPGIHRPRTLLGHRLNDLVENTLREVDVIGFCTPANQAVGPGDRFIVEQLAKVKRTPVIAIVTKTDTVDKARVANHLLEVQAMGDELLPGGFRAIVPVSALKGEQLATLEDVMAEHMPVSPPLYPDGDVTDQPELKLVSEFIREAALEGVREELPHSLTVTIEEMAPREDRPEDNPLTDIYATLYVERDSQKAIVIGKRGSRLRDVGQRARRSIEAMLGTKVYLDIRVKVAKDWQRNARHLDRFGF